MDSDMLQDDGEIIIIPNPKVWIEEVLAHGHRVEADKCPDPNHEHAQDQARLVQLRLKEDRCPYCGAPQGVGHHVGCPSPERFHSVVITPEFDSINHPKHYNVHPSGIECIDVVEHMNFNMGNAIKYLWRADLKNGLEDLRKAAWYINREIERQQKQK